LRKKFSAKGKGAFNEPLKRNIFSEFDTEQGRTTANSRSLTAIRKKRGWVREDGVKRGRSNVKSLTSEEVSYIK
jgi:hypothetical protein